MTQTITVVLACLALLCGCAAEDEEATKDKSEGVIEQAVAAQQKTVQKAQALEQQLEDAHQKKKQAIDEQTEDDG